MFRALGKSKIAFVLAILFGVSLLFFKSGSRYSNFFNSDTVVASVSGTTISTTKFNRTMQMNINKFNQMLDKSISGDEIKAFQIHSLALNALINAAVFENEYDNLNFIIDETIIAQKTKERIPDLYDDNNELNELYLKSFLQQQQLNIEDIVQIINFETRDQYVNDALFNINYPQYFSNKIDMFNKHQRKILHIELPLDQININENLINNKTELKQFYDDNINKYMSKENRDVEYILIDKKNFADNFIPNDFDIQEYYNANKNLYFQNQKRSFVQFNFKTIKEAENFKLKIKNFNINKIIGYAEENNLRFNEFIDLESDEILEEISSPLFDLKIGQKSNIINTPLAKHILILQSIKPEKQLRLNEVTEDIKNTIISIETNNYFIEISDLISEKILNGKSLNEIANEFNLKIEIINNLTQDFNKYDLSKELFFSNLISLAFGSNKDFVSDIIKVDDNNAYLFNVTKIELPKPLNFNSIEKIVVKDWILNKKIDKIKLDIEENIENIDYILQISKEYKLDITETLIDKNFNKLPRIFINEIFEAAEKQNVRYMNDNTVYIAKIKKIALPDENIKNTELITSSMANDLRNSFGEELKTKKDISINDNLINAIIKQY